ncbi:MAG: hypothetical protein AAGA48_31265 [Myxococcota bacterium]
MARQPHDSTQAIAKALAQELRGRDRVFPAVFPYNRYDSTDSTWWLSREGSPAHPIAKLCVRRPTPLDPIEVGFVVEKGLQDEGGVGHPMKFWLDGVRDWDWTPVTQRMRGPRFGELVERLAEHRPQVTLEAPALGAMPTQTQQYERRVKDWVVFDAHQWKVINQSAMVTIGPLASTLDATSMTEFLSKATQATNAAFYWYDLSVTVPLAPREPTDDRTQLTEDLVTDVVMPILDFWPLHLRESA